MKIKAFDTMIAILTVLIFMLISANLCNGLFASAVEEDTKCVVWLSLVCNGLPCSFLHQALFLQRTGKLTFCKNKYRECI